MIASVTGWEMTAEEILEIGGRIQTTRQMFNAREGAIRHEMPQRAMGSPPLTKGPIAGVSQDLEVRVQGYYEGMAFEQNGVPRPETLKSYGLESMIPDLDISTGSPERLVNEYLVSDATVKKSIKPQPVAGG
jgi:aldehyde:ferredoxin oxidoreductase